SVVHVIFRVTAKHPIVIYPLSLHDALPISLFKGFTHQRVDNGGIVSEVAPAHLFESSRRLAGCLSASAALQQPKKMCRGDFGDKDRKSTRLNSSHVKISYAVFCLKKKKKRH